MADWITTDEAAEISGYSDQYIRRLIRNEKIAADKKGGQFWINRQSLLDYIRVAKESKDQRHGPKRASK